MNSRLSIYIISYMALRDVKASQKTADEANVGHHWLRALYKNKGKSNPHSVPLQNLHDFLVEKFDMPSAINIPDIESIEKQSA